MEDRVAEIEFARGLRAAASLPERLLWGRLHGRRLSGLRFRRQHPLGPYVADFYCHEALLVVEVDGARHDGERDRRRDAWMEKRGLMVLRISARDVLEDVGVVAERIAVVAEERVGT